MQDYMTFTEMGRLAGITRQRIGQLISADPDAPEVLRIGSRPVGVKRSAAMAWLANRYPEKLTGIAGGLMNHGGGNADVH